MFPDFTLLFNLLASLNIAQFSLWWTWYCTEIRSQYWKMKKARAVRHPLRKNVLQTSDKCRVPASRVGMKQIDATRVTLFPAQIKNKFLILKLCAFSFKSTGAFKGWRHLSHKPRGLIIHLEALFCRKWRRVLLLILQFWWEMTYLSFSVVIQHYWTTCSRLVLRGRFWIILNLLWHLCTWSLCTLACDSSLRFPAVQCFSQSTKAYWVFPCAIN